MSRFYCGVDPGTRESHLVTWDSWGEERCSCLSLPNDEALAVLRAHGKSARVGDVVVIESMDARGMRLGQETLDTILWIGRFQEASGGGLVPRSMVKDVLIGSRAADDASIRLRLIDMFGGTEKAIGGGRCKACNGRGGSGRKPDRIVCPACNGGKAAPIGPLNDVKGHLWQALAVAVTYYEMSKRKER